MRTYKERFKKLIKAVEDRPAKTFDMWAWAMPTECGTACCAVGSYCVAHPKAELKLILMTEPGFEEILVPGFKKWTKEKLNDLQSCYGAIAEHFGLSLEESYNLFDPGYYYPEASKGAVLRRLKSFYKKNYK